MPNLRQLKVSKSLSKKLSWAQPQNEHPNIVLVPCNYWTLGCTWCAILGPLLEERRGQKEKQMPPLLSFWEMNAGAQIPSLPYSHWGMAYITSCPLLSWLVLSSPCYGGWWSSSTACWVELTCHLLDPYPIRFGVSSTLPGFHRGITEKNGLQDMFYFYIRYWKNVYILEIRYFKMKKFNIWAYSKDIF